MLYSIFLVLPGLLVPQGPGAIPAPAIATARIEQRCQALLEQIHSESKLPGGSAALVLPDGEQVTITVGTTDPDGGRKLVANDRLLSGSIGKTYVAAAALHLATAGKLDLDAKARKYFGGEEWFCRLAGSETVTVRQLLCHQSGVVHYRDMLPRTIKTYEQEHPWDDAVIALDMFNESPLLFEPGTRFSYSTPAYSVLGAVIQRAGREGTFVELCRLPKPDHNLEGVSLAATLKNPEQAEDRDVFLPYMTPGAYAVINRDWRYIRYDNGSEELYDLQADPNEWFNLAKQAKHAATKARLRASAPTTFAPPGRLLHRKRNLVIEGENFHWDPNARKK